MAYRKPTEYNKLIHQLQEGNTSVFEEKFSELFDWLTCHVRGKFPDQDGFFSESVAQTTLARLLQKHSQYRGNTEGEARTWLYRIAYRIAITMIEREMRNSGTEDSGRAIVALSTPDNPSSVDLRNRDYFVGESDWDAIRQKLTRQERRVLNLYLKGYRQSEIAEKLGITRPRVHQIMKRVKEKIKDQLGHSPN